VDHAKRSIGIGDLSGSAVGSHPQDAPALSADRFRSGAEISPCSPAVTMRADLPFERVLSRAKRAPRPEAPGRRERSPVQLLSARGTPDQHDHARLAEIAALPCVASVLALPDLHQKAHMEVPSSLAITTRGAVVPEFTSVAINDGMGVVATDMREAELTEERIVRLLMSINSHSAAHPLDTNRYSLSADGLREAALYGGRFAATRYGFDLDVLASMELGGQLPVPGPLESWSEVVPWLAGSRLCRSEMGLNFGGNHFLELQVVDQVLDGVVAARWGLRRDQVVVMYHLGPGPFGATLLHHFSRREKLSAARVPLFFLLKLFFHYAARRGHGSSSLKWKHHFRRNRWTAYPPDSEAGLLVRQAIALATNFGFAYRLATVAAIRDGLAEAVSPRVGSQLLCDVSHNSLYPETWEGQPAWVARHNACRRERGAPAIVAGAHDVPSYLGRGSAVGSDVLHSYDHGAGHLIDRSRREGRLEPAGGTVLRLAMTRGRAARLRRGERVPLRSSAPIDQLMECLEESEVIEPIVRLRPIGNLKN
jgi:RNA-splicing ligase RtcB